MVASTCTTTVGPTDVVTAPMMDTTRTVSVVMARMVAGAIATTMVAMVSAAAIRAVVVAGVTAVVGMVFTAVSLAPLHLELSNPIVTCGPNIVNHLASLGHLDSRAVV